MQDLLQYPWFVILVYDLLMVWPLWRIFRRAGLAPWKSLIVLAPLPVMGIAAAATDLSASFYMLFWLLGLTGAAAVLGHSKWPALPERVRPLPPKARRTV